MLNIILPGKDADGIEPAIEPATDPESRLPLDGPVTYDALDAAQPEGKANLGEDAQRGE